MKSVQFAESYTICFNVINIVKIQSFHWRMFFCITLCQPCSKEKFLASYLLQKSWINAGATTEFINSFNSYFVLIFATSYASLSKREILVDGAGKYSWSKRMLELMRDQDIGVFYAIVLAKIRRGCKSNSICWKFALLGNHVIWNVI